MAFTLKFNSAFAEALFDCVEQRTLLIEQKLFIVSCGD